MQTKFTKKLFGAILFSALSLAISMPILTAFEAHVVNVTAKIEPPKMCDARSKGYWANHYGCKKGEGASTWAAEINLLSSGYSGVFELSTGESICADIWTPNCNSGDDIEKARCKAKTHLLADELNVVSGKLQLDAFLAGADDGSQAFDQLGLSSLSTVQDAISAVEVIIASFASSESDLKRAGHVAMRVYTFYEEENPFHPDCITDPDDIPECINAPKRSDVNVENENEAEIENEIEVSANAGGNPANGGVISTGDASGGVLVENNINSNTTIISSSCEENCGSVLGTSTPVVTSPPPPEENLTSTSESSTSASSSENSLQ